MTTDPAAPVHGLEGVVVADTRISEVDGERGRVIVRGCPLRALADGGFTTACGLLWDGGWPDAAREAALSASLGRARLVVHQRLDRMGDTLDRPSAMGALRAAVAHLDVADLEGLSEAGVLTAALSVVTAAWTRRRGGLDPVAPDPDASPATDHLRMLRAAKVEALKPCSITVAQ